MGIRDPGLPGEAFFLFFFGTAGAWELKAQPTTFGEPGGRLVGIMEQELRSSPFATGILLGCQWYD